MISKFRIFYSEQFHGKLFLINVFFLLYQVNEQIRAKMFALRQTWGDFFAASKLYAIDVKVNAIDPHWPISAQKISPAIHVNPNFFSTTVRSYLNRGKKSNSIMFFFCFLLAIQSEKDLQTELQIKQRELLELKKRKLELELAATAKQLGLAVTTTAVVPTTIIDPAKMINQSDLTETYTAKRVAPVMPVVPKIQVPSLPVTSVGIFCL